ncbi:MAG TPA: Asp-tRNA(Asn)/Glu-tRNA(Gln) amidotransferase subunit GatB, partial [Burkholderiales bacterium]|nr:Asp-tRNA(Asn)/Glu-tRNA(Gln) amidotransferase subunit GatB [Burkholderiales bacterium]
MQWETVIGLEVHAQLSTRSKIFSGASTAYGAEPNVQACAVDIALPGVLPVLNKAAVEKAIKFGLAVDAMINRRSVFARKNYFYPDLPKGYQISQYEIPIVQGGEIDIVSPTRGAIKVRLTRAHLEEDAGKSFHGEAISGVVGYMVAGLAVVGNPLINEHRDLTKLSGIDLNRAGTPLLEIVSEPDMRSAEEAVAYAEALHFLVVEEISICDGNMEEGSFRFDANVSVRHKGSDKLGTRCEIKNLNSFRFLERAIEFEAARQIEIMQNGGMIEQETRLYDPDKDETRSMRTKEEAHDYRYFPDPDLLPLEVPEKWIEQVKASMPESLGVQHSKIVAYGLSIEQANQLAASRETSTFALSTFKDAPKEEVPNLANWILGPLRAKLNEENLSFSQTKVSQDQLRALSKRVADGTISNTTATGVVLPAMWKMWKAGHLDLAESP